MLKQKTYFITGFPGFIASKMIRKLLLQDPASRFEVLVHPSQLNKAKTEIHLLENDFGASDKFTVIPGDITLKNLGMNEPTLQRLRESVTHVFHLAAIYDLAVPQDVAYRVNVVGTDNVNQWVLQLAKLQRYVYFSTAYVSGTRSGRILETELDCGQSFKNFYESTKFEAEVLVQKIRDKVPATIVRPGIVMGDSKTGETVKFDGPYFIMRFLDKFANWPIPYIGKGTALINLVPVDYVVDATCYLAHHPKGEDKVYHLTDPRPYHAKDAYRMICEALIDKKPSFTLPLSLVYGLLSIPAFRKWVMVEKETIDYLNLKAEYDCTHALNDLEGSGVACPDFSDYIKAAVDFYKQHRHDPDKMILVDQRDKKNARGEKAGYHGHHWHIGKESARQHSQSL
ncbi:SDR family oxidoreductase [Polycladomyces zharkentensis]|uniref:SDR family oxidoreductase n=1 Tax=Polycladomyces zharkentensis TaxID=2807616 RepID=UPI003AF326D0